MNRKQNRPPAAGSCRTAEYLLLVATSPRDLFEMSLLLQRFGYSVCSAQSGAQALEMAALGRPALVISDLTLPDMSGLELLRKLSTGARSLPLIVTVPPSEEHVEERRFELGGAIPFLVKPLSAESLFRAVQAAIEPTPRSAIRISTRLPVRVNNTLLDAKRGEYATRLSAQGMYVRMRKPFRPNDRLTVTMHIGGRDVTADAAVLYTSTRSDELTGDPGMAVKFTSLRPDDQAFLADYIKGEVTRGLRRAER